MKNAEWRFLKACLACLSIRNTDSELSGAYFPCDFVSGCKAIVQNTRLTCDIPGSLMLTPTGIHYLGGISHYPTVHTSLMRVTSSLQKHNISSRTPAKQFFSLISVTIPIQIPPNHSTNIWKENNFC